MRKMGIGLQMYTLRDETAADFAGTLRKVAELGYEGVEFAGFGGLSAEELRSLLQETGLQAIGAHVSVQALEEDLQGTIDYIKAIGGSYIVCPYVLEDRRSDAEGWKQMFSFFEGVGAEVRRQGLVFGYHNHAFEFDIQVDGEHAFDAMYTLTSPESVQVEMDVCWVQYAGQDPEQYIAKYKGRLPLLHLKDFARDEQNAMKTMELGRGVVNLKGVISAASEAGVEWLIVEQDTCYENTPLQSVTNSLNWVKENYLQQV